MASWHPVHPKSERRSIALGLLAAFVILACLAIVGTVEGHSLDPNTGCAYGEILDARGVCR